LSETIGEILGKDGAGISAQGLGSRIGVHWRVFGHLVRPSGRSEEIDERCQVGAGKMAELPGAAGDDPFGHPIEERLPFGSDRDPHDSAVMGEALAADERPNLETIDEPGDVGGT
jgi:hypothetical protein